MPWPRPSRNHCPGHSVTRSSSISIIVTHSSVHAGIESSSSPGGGRFINAHTHYRNHETQLVLAGGLNLSRNLTTTRRDLPPNGCASAQPSPSSGCGRTNRLPNGAARQLCGVALRRLVWRQPFPHRRIRTVGHSEHASRYDSARQPGQGSPLQALAHKLGEEVREWTDVVADARVFESHHVCVPALDRNDRPRVAARCQHDVHKKPSHAPVTVRPGVNVDEHEVPEHDTNGRFGLVAQEVEERRHRVANRFRVQRNVHRAPDVHGSVAVPGK